MLRAYASYFISYLLTNLKDVDKIDNIILFGSVAKGDYTKNSDVDIFIETKKGNAKFSKEILSILNEFYKSREALYFKVKGVENKINLIIGKLNEWGEIKKSIDGTGIVLYGKYVPTGIKGKKYALIFWDNIGKNRGAFLNKLYGFKVKNKFYKGLVEQLNGKKCGKSNIMVPIQHKEEILKLIKHYKVNAKIIDIYAE